VPAVSRRELDPDRLAALEEERDFLLRSLDDLEREHDAGDVDDTDYDALKDDYTARAASVLRSIENRNVAMAAARDPRARSRAWTAGFVVVILAVALGIFVAQSSGRRAPGESVSGDIRQSTRDLLLEARTLYGEGQFDEAIKVYDKVLEQKPNDVEALTYRGWMLVRVAAQSDDPEQIKTLLSGALKSLDQAVAVDASYGDARVFRAVVYRDLDEPQLALADLDALTPGAIPVEMTALVEKLRNEVRAMLTTSGTTPRSPGSQPPTP
jgi:tetratricopeptide (TPR) repeat protein